MGIKLTTHRQQLNPSGRAQSLKRYQHGRQKDDAAQAAARKIRGTERYKRFMRRHKELHPLCIDPFGDHPGIPEPNSAPHHIVPLHRAPEQAYVMANVAPCCPHCNAKADAMERKGIDTSWYFSAWIAQHA